MPSEPIIFLVDGVLNCKRTPTPRKLPYIVDPSLLARFKRLVDQTGADVVLSSTWRYDPAGLFSAKHWGIPFIDVIPDMPQKPRRDEILFDRYTVTAVRAEPAHGSMAGRSNVAMSRAAFHCREMTRCPISSHQY